MKNKYIFLHIITILSCLQMTPLISKPSLKDEIPSAPKNIPLSKPSKADKKSSPEEEKKGPHKAPEKKDRKTDPALKKFIERFTKAVDDVPDKKPHDKKDSDSKNKKSSDDESTKNTDEKKDKKKPHDKKGSDNELKEYRKKVKKAKEAYERLFHYNEEHHPSISRKDDEEVRRGARKLFRLINVQNMVWRSNQNIKNKSKKPSENKKDGPKAASAPETNNKK